MNSSYTRQEVRPGSVQFTVSPGSDGKPSGLPKAAIAVGVFVWLILVNQAGPGFFSKVFYWLLSLAGGWAAFSGVKKWTDKHIVPGRNMSFTVSADGVMTGNGEVIQRPDITEINWTNFSTDPAETNNCALYCETQGQKSHILANGMDSSTISRLAADVARILNVSSREHVPERIEIPSGMDWNEVAHQRVERMRRLTGPTSEQQSIEPGDFILKEDKRDSFQIFTQSGTGRSFLIDHRIKGGNDWFALMGVLDGHVSDRNNLWFEGVSGGPAVLVPKDLAMEVQKQEEAKLAPKPPKQSTQTPDLLHELNRPPSAEEQDQRAKAREKLDNMRKQFAQTIITSEMQPMQPDDLILMEATPGVWEIQRITANGREKVMPVPSDDLTQVMQFGENYANGRNMWLSKLSDKGPAVLMVNTREPRQR